MLQQVSMYVNFNVNKNIDNRYSLVSYKIQPDGTRVIFDYQSNLYNDELHLHRYRAIQISNWY